MQHFVEDGFGNVRRRIDIHRAIRMITETVQMPPFRRERGFIDAAFLELFAEEFQ